MYTIFPAFLNFTLLRPDRNLKIGQVVSLPIPGKRLSGKAGTLSLRLEVSPMLEIEGIWYRQCAYCLIWCPVEEIGWSDELLSWVCDEHTISSHQPW